MNPLSTWLLRLSLALLAAAIVVPVLFLAGSPVAAQQAVPDQPEGLTGELLRYLVVGLDWDDAEGATSYRAQYWDTTGDSPAWAEAPEAAYDGLLSRGKRPAGPALLLLSGPRRQRRRGVGVVGLLPDGQCMARHAHARADTHNHPRADTHNRARA